MRFFSSLVRPDESTGAVMRWVHRIWVFFWLTVLGAGIGLLSLYLTAHSYASIDATALLQSYFKIPLLVAMNLLAPILLVYLGFFLFARPWAAYLLSALPFFTLALASYYKVQLRGDPVLATDLRLIRTAGGIMSQYEFERTAEVNTAVALLGAMLAFAVLLMPRGDKRRRVRALGAAAPVAGAAPADSVATARTLAGEGFAEARDLADLAVRVRDFEVPYEAEAINRCLDDVRAALSELE